MRRVEARDGIEPPNKGHTDLSLPFGFRAVFRNNRFLTDDHTSNWIRQAIFFDQNVTRTGMENR
jgi:hypothetical protein